MDRKKLETIRNWALSLNFRIRIYFYGSHLKGTNKPDSDLDLALEFLEALPNVTLIWIDFHEQWQKELTEIIGLNVHLELYDTKNIRVRSYVKAKSEIIFESPESPEADNEDF